MGRILSSQNFSAASFISGQIKSFNIGEINHHFSLFSTKMNK